MQVSIIIINYNTFELTNKCIHSIYAKTVNVSFEIILVDNASVECDALLFKQQFPEIILIKNDTNLGFAGGNNIGIKQAKGEYILLLNSDTELVNNAIGLSYERLENEKKIAGLTCQLLNEDGAIQHPAVRFLSIHILLLKLIGLNKLYSKRKRGTLFLGFDFDHHTEVKADWLWGTFLLLKKAVIDQMPNKELPNNYFMYCEDIEWGYLIRELGYELLYFPTAKIIHHGGKSGFDKAKKTIQANSYDVLKRKTSIGHATMCVFLLNMVDIKLAIIKKVKNSNK
jgi:GT2 family glycosyltransferase